MPHARKKTATTLDPRGALVFDTRGLGRQPGAAREETRTVPAPDLLRVELAGVPAGAEVDVDLRMEAVHEGVLVTGTASAPVVGECARCLEPVGESLAEDFDLLYRPLGVDALADEASISRADTEIGYYQGEGLLLEDVLKEQILLALPVKQICSTECKGLCPQCGANLNLESCDCVQNVSDPRWAALEDIRKKLES